VDKKIIFACSIGFSIGVTFMNIPPALDVFMVAYKASYPRISLLIGALFWSHALMQLPTGILADHIGIKRTLSAGLFCMGLGNLLLAVLPAIEVGVWGRVLTGVGRGLCGVTTMKWIALDAPGRKGGTYQGFFAEFFSIGSIFAYLLIPMIVRFGWQWAYVLSGGMSLFLLAILFMFQEIPALPGYVPFSMGRVFWIREGWVLGLVHALSYGPLISLGNWIPSFLSEIWKEPSSLKFAWCGALIMLISGLGRFSGGFLLLKFRPLTIINGSILILSILFSGLFFIPSNDLVLMLALLVGLFGSINFGAVFHLTSQATTSDSVGSLIGLVNFVANMGAAVFTLLFGWVKGTTGSFGLGFAILAFLGIMTFAVGQLLLHDRLAVKLEV
jgi:MFS transporter, ACS family, hexuronate transporter